MRIVALLGLALVCGGCAFEAPPTDASAYPTPTPADGSEAEQGWWEPFGLGAQFVAVNWMDALRQPPDKHESYGTHQFRQSAPALRYGEPRSVPRQAPSPDRGIDAGKNYGGPA
jgi:hypothetical protein